MKPPTPQAITVVILAVAIAGVLIRLVGTHSDEGIGRFQGRPVHYVLTVIAQEEAKPGKVVRATYQNRTLSQYICAPDDIAVAVIALDKSSGQPSVHTDLGQATGVDGRTYPVAIQKVGNFYFLTLKRSSRRVPDRVSAPLLFYGTTGPAKIGVTSLIVKFTKIDRSLSNQVTGRPNKFQSPPRHHDPVALK